LQALAVDTKHATGYAAIHIAASRGANSALNALIDSGADINLHSRSKYPVTALHLAVGNGHGSAVSSLLQAGANPNLPGGKRKLMPIAMALKEYRLDIITSLVDNDADLDATDSNGVTALIRAAEMRNVEAVEMLLQRGANVNAATSEGETALHLASEMGQVKIASLLLAAGADKEASTDRFELLPGYTGGGVKGESRPVHEAAIEGMEALMRILIEAGADPCALDASESNPEAVATRAGAAAVVALLKRGKACTAGNMPQAEKEELLRKSARGGDINRVRAAVAAGARPCAVDTEGRHALILAAKVGDSATFEYLLAQYRESSSLYYCPVDLPNGEGDTALMVASGEGNAERVGLLLEHGADASYRNAKTNYTPLGTPT